MTSKKPKPPKDKPIGMVELADGLNDLAGEVRVLAYAMIGLADAAHIQHGYTIGNQGLDLADRLDATVDRLPAVRETGSDGEAQS